jgi:hypothetical protein
MERTPQRVRVIRAHVTNVSDTVRFVAGDALSIGHRDRQWTSYVWCTDQAGHGGWVPDSYIEMTGEREAKALREYDAAELTVGEGEELDVIEEAGGWLLCRTDRGITGWVPADRVEPIVPPAG